MEGQNSITADDIRSQEGLEKLSEEQTEEVLEFVKSFSAILLRLYEKQITLSPGSDTECNNLKEAA